MGQEGLLLSLREENRPLPALLHHLARAVTEERLARISRDVDTMEPEEFLDRIEETYLLAGLAGVTPDSGAVSGPLSALFLRLAQQAAAAWHARRLDQVLELDNRIRALLSLAETREIGIDRTAAEESLYAAMRRAGDALEKALSGQGEVRRGAELMLALAARVNLSPRVLRGTPTALKSEAARRELAAAAPQPKPPAASLNR
ncbi:MAG: hypothetical protein HY303_09095 [Candidatus Wallbacteria bacterium]|nr:hypothetical protein [Candidatus Wallbacteria bacterium]